ncbi:LacI family DNA-binding transcriptional regulator [Brachybacterium sp. YJGR34]|uniref:LacI family DNA-binding transcriptional regulator n=1 Tax=Brachybacterium sp. YJGR34 TaxID=2059911 RepID=UPI000E0B507E|nr:LacI family DNA-binding transcriptional regulator [Brachybacterium sp. YJGR34]
MAKNRFTIADLASEAGVNKSAVSRALSGKPGVSTATRDRVLELARAHGWRPNSTARALSLAQAGAIGWVVRRTPKSSTIDPFFMDQLIGVQMELSATPYNLVLKLVDTLEDELRIYAEWESERRVDGILLTDLEVHDPRVELLRERGIPTSAVGSLGEDPTETMGPDACVSGHDLAGVHEIMRHLHATGHRRFGWVAGPMQFIATRRRVEALDEWRGKVEAITSTSTSLDPRAIAHEALTLQKGNRLTALVVDNELAAIETMTALRSSGVDVPRDVSVISWLGSELCLLSDPPLTSLEHDVTGLGRLWTRALLNATYVDEHGDLPAIEPPVLHVRSSTS